MEKEVGKRSGVGRWMGRRLMQLEEEVRSTTCASVAKEEVRLETVHLASTSSEIYKFLLVVTSIPAEYL